MYAADGHDPLFDRGASAADRYLGDARGSRIPAWPR